MKEREENGGDCMTVSLCRLTLKLKKTASHILETFSETAYLLLLDDAMLPQTVATHNPVPYWVVVW